MGLEDRPKGIQAIRALPDAALGALWDSIIVDKTIKDRLLAQAVLNFVVRSKVPRAVIPLHGLIMLTGVPGTGKTSLARGLAHRVAASFTGGRFRLLEVEPHSLASAAHGKTQRAVMDLFASSIAEAAAFGPIIVLLDEVETLAADRAKLSLDANPIDVHRATDAVLVQLDALAETNPHLLFVATSNFPQAVDNAFLSRCDLIVDVPLPGPEACAEILRDCLAGLGLAYSQIGKLALSKQMPAVAAACVGLDGRAIRKAVANALASEPDIAMNPERVTIDHVLAAARAAKTSRVKEPRA